MRRQGLFKIRHFSILITVIDICDAWHIYTIEMQEHPAHFLALKYVVRFYHHFNINFKVHVAPLGLRWGVLPARLKGWLLCDYFVTVINICDKLCHMNEQACQNSDVDVVVIPNDFSPKKYLSLLVATWHRLKRNFGIFQIEKYYSKTIFNFKMIFFFE